MSRLMALIEDFITGVTDGFSKDQLLGLIVARGHSALVQRRRAAIIITRARAVAAVFAVLTPLWIIVDYLTFD